MIVAQEQTLRQPPAIWKQESWTSHMEPERDHPGVEPEQPIHRFSICKETLDMLPTIKGVRIPTPIFNFTDDNMSAVLEVVNSDGWSSDEDSRTSTTPVMMQDSIRAIRDETMRMESILALDKLDTLMNELQVIKRELASRNAEMSEQRELIKLKENRIAMLELERDLYKADNTKLKQDLQSILSQLQASSEVSSLTDMYSLSSSDRSVNFDHFEIASVTHDASNGGPSLSDQSFSPETYHARRETEFSPRSMARYMAMSDYSAKSQNYEKMCSTNKLRQSCSRLLLKLVMQRQAASSTTTLLPPCSLSGSSLQTWSCMSEGSSVESQVRHLHGRLKSSMDLCHELRKRLALVGHYYEKLVQRLQNRLASVTSDKKQIEADLVLQLSSTGMGKQHAFRILEAKLGEKEAVIGNYVRNSK
ncbi:hypothetical protein MPSEU_000723200 [Mayamaea pseudoterrestris]|nr:hypothetical protein MPSEU_000723200 [Mayamaea pseudoterrestris]